MPGVRGNEYGRALIFDPPDPRHARDERASNFGSLAMFAAILRASSLLKQLRCGASARLILEIDIGEPAECLNKLLTRIPDFWLGSLLYPNWKYVLD
jgi:hypothetical protein